MLALAIPSVSNFNEVDNAKYAKVLKNNSSNLLKRGIFRSHLVGAL